MDAAYSFDIPPHAKWVLVTIARYADQNGETFVSAGRVGRDCNLAPSSVRRIRSELVKMGRLRKYRRGARTIWQVVGAKEYIDSKRDIEGDKRSHTNASTFAGEHRSYNDQDGALSRWGAPAGAPTAIENQNLDDEIPYDGEGDPYWSDPETLKPYRGGRLTDGIAIFDARGNYLCDMGDDDEDDDRIPF